MNEREFWRRLEFRVCGELAWMPAWSDSGWWCDGFIPDGRDDRFTVDPNTYLSGRIHGLVWMARNVRGRSLQESWAFQAVLSEAERPGDGDDWGLLLPAEDAYGWLAIDPDAKRMVVELSR
jgi:hypothetical protein